MPVPMSAESKATSIIENGSDHSPVVRRNSNTPFARINSNAYTPDESSGDGASCSHLFTRAWIYPELPWGAARKLNQKKHNKGVVLLMAWDIIIFLWLLYVAFSVPYQVGFSTADNQCLFWLTSPTDIAFAALDTTADVVFTIDIILNFVQARNAQAKFRFNDNTIEYSAPSWILSSESNNRNSWVLVDDLHELRNMYLRGDFMADVIGQIPWQYLDCFMPDANPVLKILRLLRLLKLFRLHRIQGMIKAINRKFPASELLVTVVELILTMCFVAHWMCCLWFRTGYPDGWVFSEGITGLDEDTGQYLPDIEDPFHAWVTSFYWAITTMSTIGYGDISASTTKERGLASIVMVLGCGFFAWATGRLTTILTKQPICSEAFEDTLQELHEFCENRGISPGLVTKTKAFYMIKFPTLRRFDQNKIMDDLPVELRKELLLELYGDVIKMVPIFKVLTPEVQKEVCYRIQHKFIAAGTVIMEEGEDANMFYVVRVGFVELTSGKETLKIAGRGDIFGETLLLGLSISQKRLLTARALAECELCAFTAFDWNELLDNFPEISKRMTLMAKRVVTELDKSVKQRQTVTRKQLMCPDWKTASDHVHFLTKSALQRDVAAASHVPGAQLPLRTWFTLLFSSVRLEDGGEVRGIKNSVMIVVACTDEHGRVGAIAETEVFQLQGVALADEKRVKVLYFHTYNAWDSMPGLKITVYSIPSSRTISVDGVRFFDGNCEPGNVQKLAKQGSMAKMIGSVGRRFSVSTLPAQIESGDRFQACTKLWEGELPLLDMVRRRTENITHEAKLYPVVGIRGEMSMPVEDQKPLIVSLTAKVTRTLRPDSNWWTVIPSLSAKGAIVESEFFWKRREAAVAAMKRAVDFYAADQKRKRTKMELMTLHAFAPEQVCAIETSMDGKGGIVDEEMEEQQGLRLMRNVMHAQEGLRRAQSGMQGEMREMKKGLDQVRESVEGIRELLFHHVNASNANSCLDGDPVSLPPRKSSLYRDVELQDGHASVSARVVVTPVEKRQSLGTGSLFPERSHLPLDSNETYGSA